MALQFVDYYGEIFSYQYRDIAISHSTGASTLQIKPLFVFVCTTLGLLELSSGIRNISYLSALFHVLKEQYTFYVMRFFILFLIFYSRRWSVKIARRSTYTLFFFTHAHILPRPTCRSRRTISFLLKAKKRGEKVLQFIFFRMYFFAQPYLLITCN